MTKQNLLFEAIGNIDDDIAANAINAAQQRKRKKPLTLIAIAAAAALALIVGFTTSTITKHKFSFYQNNSTEHTFDLQLTPQKFTVPDDIKSQLEFGIYEYDMDTPASRLIEQFGLTPLINDNFTDTDEKTRVNINYRSEEDQTLEFQYSLYNKNIGNKIYFEAKYFSQTEKMNYHRRLGLLPGEPSEVITLNNGSLCMVSGSTAVFSHGGAEFTLEIPYDYEVPANVSEMTQKELDQTVAEMIKAMPGIDTVKQVLADLGVL